MEQRLRPHLNYANVIATLALFVALGGAAVAAGLPKNSVGTKQLKRGAVRTSDIARAAVTAGKLAPQSVVAGKLGAKAVLPGNLGNGVINTAKILDGAVIASKVRNGAVTGNKLTNGGVSTAKLGDGAVTTSKLANDSVTLAKLAPEVSPLLGTLKSGQTLRGVFDLGSTAGPGGNLTRAGQSFQFPLQNAPSVTVLKKGETTANCGGLAGGQTPQATGGNLCVYVSEAKNLDAGAPVAENNTRLGFGLLAEAEAEGEYYAYGQWAVTAP
jgi:hypothetical protein